MDRENWASRIGFILAAVGSAVGLGNFWRFNYYCAKHGGGTFLIPYLIALVIVGIPLMMLEFGVGHKMRGSPPSSFKKINNRFEGLGWWGVTLAMFGIQVYYCVVIAWCIFFIFSSINMDWIDPEQLPQQQAQAALLTNEETAVNQVEPALYVEADNNQATAIAVSETKEIPEKAMTENYFFNEVLGMEEDTTISNFGSPQWIILLLLLLVWAINWGIAYRGVQQGIEKANKIFMPILLILSSVLVINGLTLPGSMEGIKQYLAIDTSVSPQVQLWMEQTFGAAIGEQSSGFMCALSNIMFNLKEPQIWIDAFAQIFFTLSLSFGIMITYASYLPKKSKLISDTYITAISNCSFSIFIGFAVFSVLGYFAFSSNVPVDEVIAAGPGLAFIVFPAAISKLPVLPNLFGFIFFLSLLLAGLSSAISLLEAFVASITDKFTISRKKALTLICFIGFLMGIIFTTRGGILWLDAVDSMLTNYGLVLVGIFECVVIGWFYGTHRMRIHLQMTSDRQLSRWWDISIRYLSPAILSLLLIWKLFGDFVSGEEIQFETAFLLVGVLWLVGSLIAATVLWKTKWTNTDSIELSH